LQGIQDGTLPADLDGVAPDQATSSGRTPPGAASLDRLVLNQLVTVLQATSALIAGRGGNSGGRPGTTAAAASPNVRLTPFASPRHAIYSACCSWTNLLMQFHELLRAWAQLSRDAIEEGYVADPHILN
jgi:hypothetical protein